MEIFKKGPKFWKRDFQSKKGTTFWLSRSRFPLRDEMPFEGPTCHHCTLTPELKFCLQIEDHPQYMRTLLELLSTKEKKVKIMSSKNLHNNSYTCLRVMMVGQQKLPIKKQSYFAYGPWPPWGPDWKSTNCKLFHCKFCLILNYWQILLKMLPHPKLSMHPYNPPYPRTNQ